MVFDDPKHDIRTPENKPLGTLYRPVYGCYGVRRGRAGIKLNEGEESNLFWKEMRSENSENSVHNDSFGGSMLFPRRAVRGYARFDRCLHPPIINKTVPSHKKEDPNRYGL